MAGRGITLLLLAAVLVSLSYAEQDADKQSKSHVTQKSASSNWFMYPGNLAIHHRRVVALCSQHRCRGVSGSAFWECMVRCKTGRRTKRHVAGDVQALGLQGEWADTGVIEAADKPGELNGEKKWVDNTNYGYHWGNHMGKKTYAKALAKRWIDNSNFGKRWIDHSNFGKRWIDNSNFGKRWIDNSNFGKRWVDETLLGKRSDDKKWIDASHLGEKKWIDATHLGEKKWIDATHLGEKKWIDATHLGEKKWVDASNFGKRWLDSSTFGKRWVDSSNFGKRWVDSSNFGKRWVDSSNFGKRWVDSSNFGKRWVDSSNFGGKRKRWVDSSNFGKRWLDQTTFGKRWVDSSNFGKRWIDSVNFHKKPQQIMPVKDKKWIDTSNFGKRWIDNSNFGKRSPDKKWVDNMYFEKKWIDNSNFGKRWVDSSHFDKKWTAGEGKPEGFVASMEDNSETSANNENTQGHPWLAEEPEKKWIDAINFKRDGTQAGKKVEKKWVDEMNYGKRWRLGNPLSSYEERLMQINGGDAGDADAEEYGKRWIDPLEFPDGAGDAEAMDSLQLQKRSTHHRSIITLCERQCKTKAKDSQELKESGCVKQCIKDRVNENNQS